MADKKDYYETLGVAKDASVDDIKSSYRKLAKQYHPDVTKEDSAHAEERFKEISEAYEVLMDPEKRKLYDNYGRAGVAVDAVAEAGGRGVLNCPGEKGAFPGQCLPYLRHFAHGPRRYGTKRLRLAVKRGEPSTSE